MRKYILSTILVALITSSAGNVQAHDHWHGGDHGHGGYGYHHSWRGGEHWHGDYGNHHPYWHGDRYWNGAYYAPSYGYYPYAYPVTAYPYAPPVVAPMPYPAPGLSFGFYSR